MSPASSSWRFSTASPRSTEETISAFRPAYSAAPSRPRLPDRVRGARRQRQLTGAALVAAKRRSGDHRAHDGHDDQHGEHLRGNHPEIESNVDDDELHQTARVHHEPD